MASRLGQSLRQVCKPSVGRWLQAARTQTPVQALLPARRFSTEPTPQESSDSRPGADYLQSLGSVDDHFEHERVFKSANEDRRAYTYFVLGAGRFLYASAVRLAVIRFVASWSASADVLALASVEVDLSSIEVGSTSTIKWRGKPVFIRRRTEAEIAKANEAGMDELKDPEKDSDRVQNPEWLVVLGVCTHLGCVPIPNAGEYKGWFCPCHGSHYDTSGRIRKGPAPLNLEVPQYKFLTESKLLIG